MCLAACGFCNSSDSYCDSFAWAFFNLITLVNKLGMVLFSLIWLGHCEPGCNMGTFGIGTMQCGGSWLVGTVAGVSCLCCFHHFRHRCSLALKFRKLHSMGSRLRRWRFVGIASSAVGSTLLRSWPNRRTIEVEPSKSNRLRAYLDRLKLNVKLQHLLALIPLLKFLDLS